MKRVLFGLFVVLLLLGAAPAFAENHNGDTHDSQSHHDNHGDHGDHGDHGNHGDHSHNDSGTSSGQPTGGVSLSLTMSGAILDAGTSFYSHKGGHLVSAAILGTPVDLSDSEIKYSLDATISGLTASGSASFKLETDSPGGFHTFTTGSASIVGMLPAEQFPLGCTLGVDCTSAIPGAFLGAADIKIVTCHGDMEDGQCGTAQEFVSPMTFESAFLNPFGGPIFMATDGGEVFIVADYTAARVTWTGIQLGGTVSGSLAGSPVSGLFAMNVAAVEDLKGGSEVDSGSIMFVGMSDPTLNAAGQFTGLSIIPAGTPCPASIPFPPGTCQLTGFTSSGDFSQTTALGHAIAGHYNTVWTVPAVAFSSTISATLT